MLAVGNCGYVAVCSAAEGASVPTGRRGAGHIVAAARLQLVYRAVANTSLRGDVQVVPCLITGGRATVADRVPAAHDNGTQLHYSLPAHGCPFKGNATVTR